MKTVLRIAQMEYRKWLFNKRMIVAVSFLIFIWNFAVYPLMGLSKDMSSPLNVVEPFIAACNARILCMFTPTVFMVLIADCPVLDSNSLFILVRTSKMKWVLGELLFFTLAAITFNSFIALGSIIPNAYHSFIANGWSLVSTRYTAIFPDKIGNYAVGLIPKSLYNQIAPYQAAFFSFSLSCLYMILLSEILLLMTVINKKKMGLIVAITIIAIGSALGFLNTKEMWLFPMANSVVSLHYTEHLEEEVCSIQFSILYYAVAIFLLQSLAIMKSKSIAFYNTTASD